MRGPSWPDAVEAGHIWTPRRDLPEKCPGWYCAWMMKAMPCTRGRPPTLRRAFRRRCSQFSRLANVSCCVLKVLISPGVRMAHQENGKHSRNNRRIHWAAKTGGMLLYAQIIWYVHSGQPWRPRSVRRDRMAARATWIRSLRREYPDSLMPAWSNLLHQRPHARPTAAYAQPFRRDWQPSRFVSLERSGSRFVEGVHLLYSH